MKYHFIFCLAAGLLLASPVRGAKKPKSLSTGKLDSLYNLGLYYMDHSADTSLQICNQALALIGKKNTDDWAVFISLRGFAYERLGRYRDALRDQFRVLKFASGTGDNKRLGNGYNNVGVIYDYMGNLDSAIYYYRKSYEVVKKDRNLDGVSSAASNLGLAFLNKGDFNRALDYLFEAKKTATAINDSSGLSSCLTNIGLAYDRQGNSQKALENYMQSSHIDSLLHDNLNLALSYNNIGSVYFGRKDFDKAEKFHLQALGIRTSINNQAGMSESYHNLALVYEMKGEKEKAKAFFEKALDIAESINDSYGMMTTLMDFGHYYAHFKEYDKAIFYLNRAFDLSQLQGGYSDEYKIFNFLSQAYAGKGDYKKAYEYYIRFSNISDSLQSYGNSKKLTELELESEYERKKQEDAFRIKQRELKIEADKKHARVVQWALIGGISLLLLVVVIVFRGYRNKQKANRLLQEQNDVITSQHREIEEQKNIIEEKNKSITDSIQYAQRLQNAILPPQNLLNTHLREFFILYRPKDIVSGDFYWAHESPAGFLFAVVDCTGHGVPGSMVSIIANNALNRAVNEFRLYEPAAILNKVAELVEEYFNRNQRDEIRDGMDISLCLLDRKNQKLEFAGANNSLLLIRALPDPALEELKADKQPIGHYENRKPYRNHSTQLAKGDMLYLYTDGYADQFGGQNGKKFKSSRLKEVLLEISRSPVDAQKTLLEETIDSWTGGYEQNDDICIMGVRI